MKKYTVVLVCAAALFFAGASVHAQQGGFTGPLAAPGQIPVGFAGPHGFTGQSMPINVAQVQAFPNRAPAILRGNIVAFLGGDRYLFRDASAEIVIKIKHDRWWGLSVGPNDLVELGGNLRRESNGHIRYFDAKSIRRG